MYAQFDPDETLRPIFFYNYLVMSPQMLTCYYIFIVPDWLLAPALSQALYIREETFVWLA